jgi:hypothetical protein
VQSHEGLHERFKEGFTVPHYRARDSSGGRDARDLARIRSNFVVLRAGPAGRRGSEFRGMRADPESRTARTKGAALESRFPTFHDPFVARIVSETA